MRTNRRSFLQALGIGTIASSVSIVVPTEPGIKETFLPSSASPKRLALTENDKLYTVLTDTRIGVFIPAQSRECLLESFIEGQWTLLYRISKAGAHIWLPKKNQRLRLKYEWEDFSPESCQ